jgi:hypothetical protein
VKFLTLVNASGLIPRSFPLGVGTIGAGAAFPGPKGSGGGGGDGPGGPGGFPLLLSSPSSELSPPGRLVDVVGCVEIFPFFFLYLSGGSEMVSDYFLHVDRELVVYLLPLYVRGTPSPLEAMMVPCEWVKKDW